MSDKATVWRIVECYFYLVQTTEPLSSLNVLTSLHGAKTDRCAHAATSSALDKPQHIYIAIHTHPVKESLPRNCLQMKSLRGARAACSTCRLYTAHIHTHFRREPQSLYGCIRSYQGKFARAQWSSRSTVYTPSDYMNFQIERP